MSSVIIAGDTSGSVTLQAPAVAGSTVLNLPSTLGNTGTSAFASTDASGNLGLGVTPSAWGSGFKAIQVGGYTSISTGGISYSLFGNNHYHNGTNYIYLNNQAASNYQQQGGIHTWFNSATGTAGNVITFNQAMTLDFSGNLLVGTTSTSGGSRFNHSVNSYYALSVTNTSATAGYGLLVENGSGSEILILRNSGSNKVLVSSNGSIYNTTGTYGTISDVKLKENITDATPKLEQLQQVRIVNYNLKSDPDHKQIGVIAQELEQVFPGLVEETQDFEDVPTTDKDGNETTERVATGTVTKSVKYSVFVPMLVKAIQEQQAIITQLQADVAALKGQA